MTDITGRRQHREFEAYRILQKAFFIILVDTLFLLCRSKTIIIKKKNEERVSNMNTEDWRRKGEGHIIVATQTLIITNGAIKGNLMSHKQPQSVKGLNKQFVSWN